MALDTMTDRDILSDAKEAFKLAEDAEGENRRLWLEDIKFSMLGEQWPDEVKAKREAEGRPCLTINRLPSFMKQVTNDARQNKPAIKTIPVDDDASEETSEILNGLIRNIEASSDADIAYDTALEHAVGGGYGYFRISTDYACDDQFDQDIKIERVVNPLNVYGDPYSTAADSSDWNTSFISEMMKEDEFKRKYKDASTQPFDADAHKDDWFSDKRVRIAEYWTRDEVSKTLLKLSDGSVMYEDGFLKMKEILDSLQITVEGTRKTKSHKVTQRIITGAEVLETIDWEGRYIPIIPVYGQEVNVEGKRYFISLIRPAKDPQRMFNYWRTTSTELVALAPKAPFIGPKGAFNSDAGKWASANTDTHAYIEYDGMTAPSRQPFAGVPAGALQEALNASDDMKSIMGIYDASLGAKSNETSGRAILARQREGDISTFNFIDNLSRAIKHAGRVIVDLIPHVYDAPRVIRILHEDGKTESVKINQEHIAEQPMADQGGMQAQGNPQGEREQQEQQEFAQGLVKMYDFTVGKYDVVCEAGPSFTTKREESANQMMQFVQSFPNAAPMIGDLIAKNLDWPGADDIADRLKAFLPQQAQGQNPQLMQMQQAMQQMDQHAREAVAHYQKQLEQMKQDKTLEVRKLDIDAHKAETDRLKITAPAMGPQEIQALVLQTLQQVLTSPDVLPQAMPQPLQAQVPQQGMQGPM